MVGVAALATLVTVGACSNPSNDQAVPSAVGTTTSASATNAHNQADVMFVQHMIPHHQQAIEMSDIVLGKQGIDPRVVDLAKQIKAAQAPEIEQMQAWLGEWGMPTMPMMPGMDMPGRGGMPTEGTAPSESGVPHHSDAPSQSAMPSQSMMPGTSGMPGMPGRSGMDGMMSDDDMAALQNAQGVEASTLFLTQMIKHHEGAISMAQDEINSGQYPATTAMARSIVTSQQQEIDSMKKILASL